MPTSKDFLANFVFLAIGGVAIFVARDHAFGTTTRMGPGYFRTVLGGILVLFGIFLMARGARSREQAPITWGWKPLACIVLSMVLFGFLRPISLAFMIGTALVFVAMIAPALRRKQP